LGREQTGVVVRRKSAEKQKIVDDADEIAKEDGA
jgi:hypothetical protein